MVSGRSRLKLPLLGGTLTISIAEASKTRPPSRRLPGNLHSSKADAMSRIQRKAKLGNAKLSDEIENLTFEIKWEPTKGAFGVIIPTEDCTIPEGYLTIVWWLEFLILTRPEFLSRIPIIWTFKPSFARFWRSTLAPFLQPLNGSCNTDQHNLSSHNQEWFNEA